MTNPSKTCIEMRLSLGQYWEVGPLRAGEVFGGWSMHFYLKSSLSRDWISHQRVNFPGPGILYIFHLLHIPTHLSIFCHELGEHKAFARIKAYAGVMFLDFPASFLYKFPAFCILLQQQRVGEGALHPPPGNCYSSVACVGHS